MTDKQIMFLSEIAYLDEILWPDKCDELGSGGGKEIPDDSTSAETLGEMLEVFDDAKLAEMDAAGGEAGKQAAVIRAIQADQELCDLEIFDINSDVFAITFENENGEKIIAFRGTGTGYEWYDNAIGLGETDTECQKMALEYIESMDGEHFTVTGHSKGGNKAQYVTLLSDKVGRCVSMDGQGFSGEFVDKYQGEIAVKGNRIKNYYVDGDYVNLLLYPVPGATQICVDSPSDVSGVSYHYATSFYHFYVDGSGKYCLGYVDEQGMIHDYLQFGEREPIMQMAHDFTCFALNVMPREDRQKMQEYIGALLAIVRRGVYQYKGTEYTNVKEFLLSDPEMLGMLLAYVIKYAETYGLSIGEIESLIDWLGMRELLEDAVDKFNQAAALFPGVRLMVGSGVVTVGALFSFLMKNLHDGGQDHIINWIFSQLGAKDVWAELEKSYKNIPKYKKKTANQNYTGSSKIRDFTSGTAGRIDSAIRRISGSAVGAVHGWSQYSSEEWYDDLLIDNAIRGISTYFSRIRDINQQSDRRINQVFNEARSVDMAGAAVVRDLAQNLQKVTQGVNEIAQRLK